MALGLGDIFSGTTLQGIGSGALTGGMVGGPYGAITGGLIGGGLGAYANSKKRGGVEKAQSTLDETMSSLNLAKTQDYAQRMKDLKAVQSFYGPAIAEWNRLYGQGGAPTQTAGGLGSIPVSGRF